MERSKQSQLNEYARSVIRNKARQLIGKYGFTHDDREDLEQEMVLDLLVRLPRFDPEKACLNTFVSRIVDRKVSTMIRRQRAGKRDHRREAWSLDEPIGDGGGADRSEAVGEDDPEPDRLDLRLDLQVAVEDLSPELRRLVELLLTHTKVDAAAELGVPRSTLYGNGIARLRKAFEDRGLREYL